jgi:hypothetical protein
MAETDFEGRGRGRPPKSTTKIGARIDAALDQRIRDYADANFMKYGDALAALIERGLNGPEK